MTAAPARKRLIGIDAARGVALIGLMAIHILPDYAGDSDDPSLTWHLFSGNSAALFALLAGMGLAFATGGRTPHTGRRMLGDRVALIVRAVLIGAVALGISTVMPEDPPGILLYYTVFFLLALPFLHLGAAALFCSGAAFGIVSPILMQQLGPVLPDWSSVNPTVGELLSEPAGAASQLLLTGTYPALPYMCYLLVGLGIGRLDLRNTSVLARIAVVGATMSLLANAASAVLLHVAGGYGRLLETSGMTTSGLDEALAFGPDLIPDTSLWWLAIVTPHTNMPLAIADSLGLGLLVTAVFLLVPRRAGVLLAPLAALGSMTLTLYSAHLLALAPEIHDDEPLLWFLVHLSVATAFALAWKHRFGQGPLERTVAAAAKNFRQIVDDDAARSAATMPGPVTAGPGRAESHVRSPRPE
jgi:uncharacterized membrane protein